VLAGIRLEYDTGYGDATSDEEDQIMIEWIYRKWKCFFSSVEDLLDKLPNQEENPIVKSDKAQRLNAMLCKTLKSEIRSTHKCTYDFQVFWETAITSVTKEEDEWRMEHGG
jgi:hypothetical protein